MQQKNYSLSTTAWKYEKSSLTRCAAAFIGRATCGGAAAQVTITPCEPNVQGERLKSAVEGKGLHAHRNHSLKYKPK